MKRLYNAALFPLRLALAAWGGFHILTRRREDEWRERLARRVPVVGAGGIWIHGASVGEARIVGEIARGLRGARPTVPLSVSAQTATGRGRLPRPPLIDAAFFLPLDFSGLPSRMLAAVRPRVLVIVETELWPNLLREAHGAGVPVVVVNGGVSGERMVSYRRLTRLYRPLLARLTRVGVRSEADAARFLELGTPTSIIRITGNVKYDLPTPAVDPEGLRRRLDLPPERPVFVAGSTARGEDALVLEAFGIARNQHPGLLLVLAPRHPERAEEVGQIVRAAGHDFEFLSSRSRSSPGDVLLVDTIGQLEELYSIATAAFVGGSLVPRGGHNVLEPAVAGVPVLYGPHTDSVSEPARALEQARGSVRVRSARELGEAVASIITDVDRAARLTARAGAVLAVNRGAVNRSLEIVLEAFDREGDHEIGYES
jgi:3-deoxy-D-manno-octulosonic-acid transferase